MKKENANRKYENLKNIMPIYAPNLKEFLHHVVINYFIVVNEKCNQENTK